MSATCQITTLSAPLFFRLDAPSQMHTADMAASGGMDLSINTRNVSSYSPISSVSSSTTQPRRSSNLHSPKMSSNSASDMAAVSGIIASAGSAEEAVYKLAKEKQALAAQNAQLWSLVQKQRDLVKGLNKDLERALKEKERYSKRLKDHATQIPALPSVDQGAFPAKGRQLSQSPTGAEECDEGQSPSSTVSVRDIISNGLRYHASSSSPHQVRDLEQFSQRRSSSSSARAVKSFHSSDTRMQKLSSDRKGDMLSAQGPHRPPSLDTLASTSTTSSSLSQWTAATSLPTRGPTVIAIPGRDGLHQTRKAPPAPLNLAIRDRDTSSSQPVASMDRGIADPSAASENERGRRKTREDDDRQRETLAFQEEEHHRCQSQKDSMSKSKTPIEKPVLHEKRNNALPQNAELPFGFHPSHGLPTSPRAAQLSPLQPQHPGSITETLSSAFQGKSAVTQSSILALPPRSPGLPMSPRPSDRPLNSPMPRIPNQPLLATPMTPSVAGLPLSPRPPRQPIPLPPVALLSSASPYLVRTETYQQFVQPSSAADQLPSASDTEPDPGRPSRAATPPSSPGPICRGLMRDEFPGLLLSPDALFSVDVKISSSRLKPSRNSLQTGVQKWSEEDPVLTLAVNCRSTGKQFWQVEKTVMALFKLDSEIRSLSDFDVRIPDKSLFNGDAPAKVDARRAALNDYLDAMIGYQWNPQAALALCEFLSTDAIEPRPEVSVLAASSHTVGLATNAEICKEGYLTEKGKSLGGWKVRYFVLEGPELRYFESRGGAHLGTIRLQNAQIGKQQCSSGLPVGREDNPNEHFRHAFVILERKQKDRSSLLRHVLCAESDEERDAWVEAVLQYVEQVSAADEERNLPWDDNSKYGRADLGGQQQASSGNPELLQGVNYEDTVAAEAPLFGPLSVLRGAMPSPSLNGYHGQGHHVSLSKSSNLTISAPTNGVIIQDAEAWGNKKEKELRKRSIFGFRGRSSSDSSATPHSSGPQAVAAQSVGEYAGLPRPAFGVPLTEAVEYNAPVGVDVYLPAVVYRCIEYLHAKGAANEEGIFRLSGSHVVTKGLRDRFNNEGDVKLLDGQYYDIHAVASLLKTYLRELPAAVLTRELQLEFLKVLDMSDIEDRLAALNILTHRLPRVNAELLKALFRYLIDIVNNAGVNKMNIRNVGIVFSPTLNIAAPLISHFLSDFNAIFGSATDRSFPLDNTAVTNVQHSADAVHPLRRQIYPEISTMVPTQTSFQSSTTIHNKRIAQAAHSVKDTGFVPWQPMYDLPCKRTNMMEDP